MTADTAERETRQLILDAAEELFARKGFAATSVKEIGQASGTNPALLYYYFANKESLYRAVLARLAEALVGRGTAALDEAGTPEDAVRAIVAAQAGFLREHPRAPALLVREMLDSRMERAGSFLNTVASRLFRRLLQAIEEGQRAGRFQADADPRFAAISTISQLIYFHLAAPALLAALGGEHASALEPAFTRHAGEFAVRALETSPVTAAGKGRTA